MHRRMRSSYIFVENPEGKRPYRRPRRRWEDNIRMILGNRLRRCELGNFLTSSVNVS
jgi:hypothetical protein